MSETIIVALISAVASTAAAALAFFSSRHAKKAVHQTKPNGSGKRIAEAVDDNTAMIAHVHDRLDRVFDWQGKHEESHDRLISRVNYLRDREQHREDEENEE